MNCISHSNIYFYKMTRRITNAMRIDTISEFFKKNSQTVPDTKKKTTKQLEEILKTYKINISKEIVNKPEYNYGETARKNGELFEGVITEWCNIKENKEQIMKKIGIGFDASGYFEKCSTDKVYSIHSKKTTRKADIWYICKDKKIGISIKMSNNGTQLQIISLKVLENYLELNNVKIGNKTKKILEKFLGIIKPTDEELDILNKNRIEKLKNKKRWWINEMDIKEQDRIVKFFNTHYNLLLRLILTDGLCINKEDKAELFILNNSNYTKTKKISPIILTIEELISKFSGKPKITINGSLELNDFIGLQRKGSGGENSANCLQFKDRGYRNLKFI